MRLNIIAWDISKETPELISDYWQPSTMIEECIEDLIKHSKESPLMRAIIIDWATREVIAELKGEKILRYPLNQEVCICAAIQMEDGTIFRGHRHADAMKTAYETDKYKNLKTFKGTQGFITSKNRYVGRTEGAELQKAAGIESIMPKGQEFLGKELYSEDLY